MNKLWMEKAAAFHGHSCPGLALGVRLCEYAQERLDLTFSGDEQIVCIAETDSCVVDAIQALLGCTTGKGNLIYRPTGKTAFSFYNRLSGESVRIVARQNKTTMEREARKLQILNAPLDELFLLTLVKEPLPEHARIFRTVVCELCGEGVAEHMVRLQDGKCVCLHCFQPYDR